MVPRTVADQRSRKIQVDAETALRLRGQAERLLAEAFPSIQHADGAPRVAADVYEDREAFRVTLEVPGVPKGELTLSVAGNQLIIEGRKSDREVPDHATFECAERAYGPFRRVIDLPGAADTSRVDARLERGVLEVVLPRIRERRGRRREVPIG